MRRRWPWLLLLVIVVAGAAWWELRPRPSDKEQIERVINQIKAGVENKNPRQIMAHISPDYRDSTATTYREARVLSLQLRRLPERIRVNLLNYKGPMIKGDSATLGLTVELTLSRAGASDTNTGGDLELSLRREKGEWKVVSAEGWQQWSSGLEE